MHSFCARISSGSIGETFSKVLDISEIYKHVKSIDRKLNGLASNLFTPQTKNHDNQAPIITDSESQCEAQVDVDVVKNEVIENEIFNDLNFDDGLIDETPNFPPLEYKPDLHVKITNRKRKDLVKSTSKSDKYKHTIGCESSDDEPLSYKVTKNTEFRDTDIAVSKKFDIPELKTVLSTKESPKMSKQRNDFNDFEDYAAVIVLTPEDARMEVLLRKKSSNYINSPLKCDLCYRGNGCKFCGECFSSSQDLKAHLRVHARRHAARHYGTLPGLCSMVLTAASSAVNVSRARKISRLTCGCTLGDTRLATAGHYRASALCNGCKFCGECFSSSQDLKAHYVPRTVLKERYESAPEEDEVAHDVSDPEHDDVERPLSFSDCGSTGDKLTCSLGYYCGAFQMTPTTDGGESQPCHLHQQLRLFLQDLRSPH
ncbi:Uncharacterized protein OBRU01_12223 [Operophtera brumata]|uniref:C2H2-type domain-containing protein n=1 Tax=Operophtera brumata TaxID=104452 RepID=A0A0L7LBF3_OPEBR|nr:Uncharacterized protein OBRU01_12223 [Operophtera brumata]